VGLLFLAAAILYRVNGVAYSYLATDIVYSGSALYTVSYALGLLLSPVLFGLAAGGVILCCGAGSVSRGGRMLLLGGGVYLADGVAKVLIDLSAGAVHTGMLWAAILSSGLEALFCIWMLTVAFLYGRSAAAGRLSPVRACVYAALVHMAGRMLGETVYLIRFLIDVDFLPYASEIVQIIGSYLQIAALHGGVAGLTMWGVCRVFLRKNADTGENLHKI